jgi:hypothetical protein
VFYVISIVSQDIDDGRTVSGVTMTTGKPTLKTQLVCALTSVGSTTLLVTALPEHVLVVSTPKTDRDRIILKKSPVDTVAGLTTLHVDTCIEELNRITAIILSVIY